jgi:hypothetical protein
MKTYYGFYQEGDVKTQIEFEAEDKQSAWDYMYQLPISPSIVQEVIEKGQDLGIFSDYIQK